MEPLNPDASSVSNVSLSSSTLFYTVLKAEAIARSPLLLQYLALAIHDLIEPHTQRSTTSFLGEKSL
ncbi:hypothetical protein IQ268_23480 [Oculatella sp. LEGE 06141]|uniref:hypothetical protein n=1 Tax=Oculatella sp. LEGE 06141 TaxID=1828648 RepID=UPI00187FBB7E|nr:hypothetical protein [Oculatella sp. LEGE 06141]MBE9181528.1 hypothetical protein [Oculatella sp. LEGE 06141]